MLGWGVLILKVRSGAASLPSEPTHPSPCLGLCPSHTFRLDQFPSRDVRAHARTHTLAELRNHLPISGRVPLSSHTP